MLAEEGNVVAVNSLLDHIGNLDFMSFSIGFVDAVEGYTYGNHAIHLDTLLATIFAEKKLSELQLMRTLYSLTVGFSRQGYTYEECIRKSKTLLEKNQTIFSEEYIKLSFGNPLLKYNAIKGFIQGGHFQDKVDEFTTVNNDNVLALFTIVSGYIEIGCLSEADNILQKMTSIEASGIVFNPFPTTMKVYTGLEFYYALAGYLDGPNLTRTLCLTSNKEFRKKLAEYAATFNEDLDVTLLLEKVEKIVEKISQLMQKYDLNFNQAETYYSVMSKINSNDIIKAFAWEQAGDQLVEQGIPAEILERILSFITGFSELENRKFFLIAKEKIGFFTKKPFVRETEDQVQINSAAP
ncbi:hypothetical protein [Legionella sp. PC997]|uniref:hypothetical protein n=1 Tax=Legionella sp. PC997 TaxID=2755562 RepID=UPI0015FB3E45|nr:hypothetical protein [Legionella sp. PC997]